MTTEYFTPAEPKSIENNNCFKHDNRYTNKTQYQEKTVELQYIAT